MNSNSKNHYEVLGVSPDASDEEIKQAFHDFAKNNHPDRNPENTDSEQLFKEAALAYETLKDPLRRQAFDEAIAFDKRNKRSGRHQGRRLLMLFALLLFAPSALFLSLFISGDKTFLSSLGFLPEVIGTHSTASVEPDQAAGDDAPASATASNTSSGEQGNGEAENGGEVLARSAAPRTSLPEVIGPKAEQSENQSVPASPETLASLGENTKSVQSPIPVATPVPVAPPPPEITLSANVDVSGPFSDCNICPLMFIPRRFLPGIDGSNRAISMSEITVAQWEDCVNDGACPDLDQGMARKNDPVTGIDKEAADRYSAWLTKVTGQAYATVMPETASDCASQPNRVTSNNWDWMKSPTGETCATPEGFRVLRQTEPAS